MVKGNPKTSASSATRKKHAKKHAAPEDPVPNSKGGKGGKGKKNREPRVKMYIPPVKPAPIQPDPLETTGLAHTLPAELLVVLRNLSKKAQITKARALEDLQLAWVDKCLKDRDEATVYTLVEMLPVWLHHIPSLLINPSRRIRLVAVTLQSSFLQIQEVNDQLIFFLRKTASSSQLENILGALFLASHDIDRSVASISSKIWDKIVVSTLENAAGSLSSARHISLDDTIRSSLTSFIQRAALDPNGVYASFNPVAPTAPSVMNSHQSKKGSIKGSQVSTPRGDGGDQTPRSKIDEQEESEQDRMARLRIGALGALRWLLDVTPSLSEDLKDIFANLVFWTVLSPLETPVWVDFESFGFRQPNVRKSAWSLVQSLLTFHHDELDPLVPILSTAILRSSWLELDASVQGVMWQPLLTFLKAFPQSWTIELGGVDDIEDEADNQGQDLSEENRQGPGAYREFLQFLELGCSGSPIQGYPTVIVVLSTIPPCILFSSPGDALSLFYTAFWAAVDGRALTSLHRTATASAFLSALLECTIFLLKRIQNSQEGTRLIVDENRLLKELFSRVWIELSDQKLTLEDRALAKIIPQTLRALVDLRRILFDAAWEALAIQIKISSQSGKKDAAHLVSVVLKAIIDPSSDLNTQTGNKRYLKEKADELLKAISKDDIERIEGLVLRSSKEGTTNFDMIEEILEQFREELFIDQVLAAKWDILLFEHAFKIFSLSPNLLLSYFLYRNDEARCLTVWRSLLTSLAASGTIGSNSWKNLLKATQNKKLPRYLKPEVAELDDVVADLLERAVNGSKDSDEALVFTQILVNSGYFLSQQGYESIVETITSNFTSSVQLLLEGKDTPMANLGVTLSFIEAIFSSILQNEKLMKSLLPVIFNHAYLVPLALPESAVDFDITPSQTISKGLWEFWLSGTCETKKRDIIQEVVHSLGEFMIDSNVYPLPTHLLRLIAQHPPGLQVNLLEDVFPSRSQLDAMLDEFSPEPNDPTLAILNDLLPTSSHPSSKNKVKKPTFTDRHGFSPYARVVNGLSQAFIEDRQLAKRNLWALRHLLALSVYAQDLKNVPSSYQYLSPLFDGKVSEVRLEDVMGRVKRNSVYLLNFLNSSGATGADLDGNAWKCGVVERFLHATAGRDASKAGLNDPQLFLFDILWHSKRKDATRDARIMKSVLESLLADGVGEMEAGLWVQLARMFESAAPESSIAIISVLSSVGAESPRLDRYRNELAASLLDIKPRNANGDLLTTLRKLTASAPSPNSDVAFLPTLRAVNVLKALQAWVLAELEDEDDEINEDVESVMLPVFANLAPILQSVTGSHWPFIFDVLESVLDRASGLDGDDHASDVEQQEDVSRRMEHGVTLVGLARALRLVMVIEELTTRNKSLMEDWKERREGIMKSILNLEILRPNARYRPSKPFSTCRELALSILEHLPLSSPLIDESTLPKMVHLLEDSSYKVQKMAYKLLTTGAKKRTEHLVIEAGVATGDNDIEYTLPIELLEILKKEVDLEGELDDNMVDVFGYLLGWMVVFDSFVDASFKVRSSYIDQIRTSNIVLETLIPCFLHLLGLERGGLMKGFKLDIWGVDSFFANLYEPGRPHTIPVFMAHVYYRALLTIPSLIYSWVLDCKDRQLTNAVTTYTSAYFSPVLIKAELEHVRASAASGELVDEKMSVKVVSTSGSAGVTNASAGGEVIASYLVDEHQLEIRIRIPSDWPLHRVEVKDVKRVGVDENRWRAWVLGVQQTIWAHNGRIVDGLGHFKKNVNLHFEGQVECAICYSIISVMDGSLPKKPCKTCKNRFHAGCLYKWFNTSHSSSCPLCRSDII